MDPTKQFHHLLQRFEVFCRDVIDPAVYPASHPLEVAAYQCAEPIPFAHAAAAAFAPVTTGWEWGPVWSTCWFRIRGRVPASMAGRAVVLRFSTDTEALVWKPTPNTPSKGTPLHGLDVNRDAVRLFDPATPPRGGEDIELFIEAACNHLFGDRGLQWDPPEIHRRWNSATPGRLDRCELAVLDETVWRLKWVYTFALQLARELPHDSARARELFAALRRCTNAIPDDRVSASAAAALADLEAVVRSPAGGSATLCHAVGHAHIDTAWLWPIRETKRKCLRTFSTTLRLMERDRDYRFLCSQAQQYAWLEETSPELFQQVKARVAEGRWEPGGAMWVEPDCNVPSGESLIRQILHADRYWRAKFGDARGRQRFLYLPDTFGFPPQLPQIMRLAGLDTFITNKLHWNDTNTFPHTTFIWRGLDGSEVVGHNTPGMDYNALLTPRELIRGEKTHKNKDLAAPPSPATGGGGVTSAASDGGGAGLPNFHAAHTAHAPHTARWLQPFGFGDGGGGPTDWNLLNADLAASSDSLPRVRFSTVGDFCDALHADIAAARTRDPAAVPIHEGELYLELHRGTLTTHARIKQANAECEELLRQAEILTFAGPTRLPANEEKKAKADLDRAWKLLLLNQFHDILPGSSIGWVYQDAERDYAAIRAIAQPLIERGMAQWADAIDPDHHMDVATFNPASRGILGATRIIGRARNITADALSVSLHDSREPLTKAEKNSHRVSADRLVLDNPAFGRRVTFDKVGRIVSLVANEDTELCIDGSPMGQIALYEDRPRLWDAWDFDAEAFEKPSLLERPADKISIVENGPVTAAIRFEHRLGATSRLALIYHICGTDGTIFVTGEIDWRERHRLLRACFPGRYHTRDAAVGTQFGHAVLTSATRHERRAMYEYPAHRFISLTTGASHAIERFSLLLDRPRGISLTDAGAAVSLLRAPTYPDPEADQGPQSFRLAILAGGRSLEPVILAAEEFQRPPRAIQRKTTRRSAAKPAKPKAWQPLTIASYPHHVEIDAIKPGDKPGQLIVRFSERAGRCGDVTITWNIPVKSVRAVDLLERPTKLSGLAHDAAAGRTVVSVSPFQIVTLAVTRAD